MKRGDHVRVERKNGTLEYGEVVAVHKAHVAFKAFSHLNPAPVRLVPAGAVTLTLLSK